VLCSHFSLTLLTLKGEYEDTESNDGGHRRRKDGGTELLNNSQHIMSANSQEPDALIQSEFSHPADGARPGTWSQVASTRSWHTPTVASSNAHSGFEPNRYGRPGADTASVHSFNSSFAERSQTGSDRTEMRNGFAKIKAYVSTCSLFNSKSAQGIYCRL